jgi:hypothetical protein
MLIKLYAHFFIGVDHHAFNIFVLLNNISSIINLLVRD